jgi:hypothetical protein
MIGKLKDITFNGDGTQNVTVTVGADFMETFDKLKDGMVKIEIKKASNRRSNNQNAFCWTLIDQIAAETHLKVSEVYRNAIREIGGVSTTVGMKDDAIPVFRESWEKGHLGRQVEIIPGSTKPGWSNVKIFFGSSEFDTEQMSRLLDILIQDAEALGIPTISDKEMERLGIRDKEHYAAV